MRACTSPRCAVCGGPLPAHPGRGRKPLYCDADCRLEARAIERAWLRQARGEGCTERRVPAMPEDLRVREFPRGGR